MSDFPEIIAHRGRGAGAAADNTLGALCDVLMQREFGMEIDVHLTRDGAVVVHHDHFLSPATARPTTATSPPIPLIPLEGLTLQQVREYQVLSRADSHGRAVEWAPLPLLSEFLARWKRPPSGARLYIEMKTSPEYPETRCDPRPLAEAVVRLVEEHAVIHDVSLMQFDWRALVHSKQLNPAISRCHLEFPTAKPTVSLPPRVADMLDRMRRDRTAWCGDYDPHRLMCSPPQAAALAGATGWAAWQGDIDAAVAADCRRQGIALIAWGVDGAVDVKRLRDWGVETFITDTPDHTRDRLLNSP